MFSCHSPQSTEGLFEAAHHSLVFSATRRYNGGNNSSAISGHNNQHGSLKNNHNPQPITAVAARSVFECQQPAAAINTAPGCHQFVLDNTAVSAFPSSSSVGACPPQSTMMTMTMAMGGHYELASNTPSDILMPSSVADCTSPMQHSPLRPIHIAGQTGAIRKPTASGIKTPIPRISDGRVNKATAGDTPYHRRHRLTERTAMPILADHILDMRLCSSPAPSDPNAVIDSSGEVHRLPHHISPKDTIRRISPQTMVDLLDGRYAHCYDRLLVIDCRYPYEYLGGHIPGAINVNRPDAIDQLLLENPPDSATVHTCIIFHCEFSSQRAPRMALHVRNFDRLLNSERYPHLHYPEIYILDGGYKAFFDSYSERCDPPNQYLPMKNPNNKDDLRHHQKLRQSFRGHWAHSHISKRPAKHFQKSQSLLTIDPARSFFKQLSESNLCCSTTAAAAATGQLDSANEFDMLSQDLQDLPSSIY